PAASLRSVWRLGRRWTRFPPPHTNSLRLITFLPPPRRAMGPSLSTRPPRLHLRRPPVILGALAVDLLWARPALGRAKHDHRPPGSAVEAVSTRISFDALDLAYHSVQRCCHQLVHLLGLASLDEVGRVAVTP